MCDCPHIITRANRHQKQGCIAHSAIPVTRVVKLRTFRSLKTRSPLPRSISITSAVDSASQMASCRGFGLSDGLLQRAGGSSFDPPASVPVTRVSKLQHVRIPTTNKKLCLQVVAAAAGTSKPLCLQVVSNSPSQTRLQQHTN